jgi:hypothetical protein
MKNYSFHWIWKELKKLIRIKLTGKATKVVRLHWVKSYWFHDQGRML